VRSAASLLLRYNSKTAHLLPVHFDESLRNSPLFLSPCVNGRDTKIEFDTVAAVVSLMSHSHYDQMFSKYPLQKSSLKLRAVNGPYDVMGPSEAEVTQPNCYSVCKLPLVVVCKAGALKVP